MAQGFVSCLPTSLKRVILRILMVVTEVIRQVAGRLKNGVLPKNDVDRYAHHLNVGNELCRGRTIPMSPQLINKVKFIYRKCQLDFPKSKSTPLMIASARGNVDMVWGFIQCAKEIERDLHTQRLGWPKDLLWLRRRDGSTALDIAIMHDRLEVAKLLLSHATREDLDSVWNDYGKIIFPYIHDQPKHDGFIFEKLEDETRRAKQGLPTTPNEQECIKYLLQERPDLVNEKDEKDWTPCRYAVHYNSSLAMEELLNVDHSVGFQLVTQDNSSALHVAASLGHCETMKVLMSICLGSPEFDSKGRNILHVAIESKQTEVIEFIFQDESLTSLINQKDNNGDTPAHLLAKLNLEIMEKVIDSRVNIHSLNNDNRTPLDLIDSDEKRKGYIKAIAMGTKMSNKISTSSPEITMIDYDKELEDKQKKAEAHFKMVDNMVLVVTLIATATFAAAFTVPGGFNSDKGSKQGTPYLLRKVAFQAFIITDAIAFSCSFSVLLAHIALLIYRNHYDEAGEAKREYIDRKIVIMYYLTGFALVAMLVAIVTGLYVVLLPSLWLAIFICVLSIGIVVVSFFV